MKKILLLILLLTPFICLSQQRGPNPQRPRPSTQNQDTGYNNQPGKYIKYISEDGKNTIVDLSIIYNTADSFPKNILHTQFPSFEFINGSSTGFPISLSYKRIFSRKIQGNAVFLFPIVDDGKQENVPHSKYFEASIDYFFSSKDVEKDKRIYIEQSANYYDAFKVPFEVRKNFGARLGFNYALQSNITAGPLNDSVRTQTPLATKEACVFAGIEYQKQLDFKGNFSQRGFVNSRSIVSYYLDLIFSPAMSALVDLNHRKDVSDYANVPDLKFVSPGKYFSNATFIPLGFRLGFNACGSGRRRQVNKISKLSFNRGIKFEIGFFPFYQTALYFNFAMPLGLNF